MQFQLARIWEVSIALHHRKWFFRPDKLCFYLRSVLLSTFLIPLLRIGFTAPIRCLDLGLYFLILWTCEPGPGKSDYLLPGKFLRLSQTRKWICVSSSHECVILFPSRPSDLRQTGTFSADGSGGVNLVRVMGFACFVYLISVRSCECWN